MSNWMLNIKYDKTKPEFYIKLKYSIKNIKDNWIPKLIYHRSLGTQIRIAARIQFLHKQITTIEFWLALILKYYKKDPLLKEKLYI